jgi:hypothetical protein
MSLMGQKPHPSQPRHVSFRRLRTLDRASIRWSSRPTLLRGRSRRAKLDLEREHCAALVESFKGFNGWAGTDELIGVIASAIRRAGRKSRPRRRRR